MKPRSQPPVEKSHCPAGKHLAGDGNKSQPINATNLKEKSTSQIVGSHFDILGSLEDEDRVDNVEIHGDSHQQQIPIVAEAGVTLKEAKSGKKLLRKKGTESGPSDEVDIRLSNADLAADIRPTCQAGNV